MSTSKRWKVYTHYVDVLNTEFGISPSSETVALYDEILLGSTTQEKNRLPNPTTPFIGREAECKTVLAYLARPSTRLVTILGIGGTGKTRLALEVAQRLLDNEQSVWFVALAGVDGVIADISALADVVGDALGLAFSGDLPLVLELLTTWLPVMTIPEIIEF